MSAEWQDDAACKGMDPELFFPGRGERVDPEVTAACDRCEVRAECLNHAILNIERRGIWGGKSERQRRNMRAVARPVGAPMSRECKRCGCRFQFVYKGGPGQFNCDPCRQETRAATQAAWDRQKRRKAAS